MGARFKNFIGLLNGYRKFTIYLLLIIVSIVFRLTNFINGAEFVDLLKGTGIAFFATNGVEHMAKTVQEWVKKKI